MIDRTEALVEPRLRSAIVASNALHSSDGKNLEFVSLASLLRASEASRRAVRGTAARVREVVPDHEP